MAKSVSRKDHPLSMRLPAGDIAIIDRAAVLRGRSRTDFVRQAAVRAAEDAILETRLIRLTPAGLRMFAKALTAAPGAVPQMVTVLKRKAPWEGGAKSRR
ncbi:MAG TPA: DUF1778 domain-containing protein [Rhizomicrobium sp.]